MKDDGVRSGAARVAVILAATAVVSTIAGFHVLRRSTLTSPGLRGRARRTFAVDGGLSEGKGGPGESLFGRQRRG